ncbi:MAG: hypothetical protein D6785_07905 [Planctomycetota bacterium]|nr:MAG: hypothetical protein D6785_07905 [Planctomycetota bacterium]
MAMTKKGMEEIEGKMAFISSTILKLNNQSQNIGEIIEYVKDLADQSNLLAVNASIEAAKAGEYGKGFSVVAQEIKNLADQSKESTTKIREILQEIQKGTNTAVLATEEGTKSVKKGREKVSETEEAFASIVQSVQESAQASKIILNASKEQLVGMEQIAEAMANIKEATTENLESTKQIQKVGRQIRDLAESLKKIVEEQAQ